MDKLKKISARKQSVFGGQRGEGSTETAGNDPVPVHDGHADSIDRVCSV